MGTSTPDTCIPGLVWQKQARRFSQFELKVGELGFPIHFVCVSTALYHRGVRGRHFPLRWIWPISVCTTVTPRDDVLFVLYEEKSPIPRSKQTPVEQSSIRIRNSSLPRLAKPYDPTFCTTFRVYHTNFAAYGLFLKFRGFRGLRIFFFYNIISVSKHIFSGSPELRPNQNWLYSGKLSPSMLQASIVLLRI